MPEQFPEVYGRRKNRELTARAVIGMLGMAGTGFYRMVRKYEEKTVPKGGQI